MEYTTKLNSLESILSKVKAGDKVLIEDGTYNNISLNITSKGTLDKRITIKALNPGKVFITGSFKLNMTGNYCTFANFVMKDGGVQNGIQVKGNGNRITNCDISFNSSNAPVVALYGKNNRLDHCIFQNFSKAGVWVEVKRTGALDYILIDHNIFRNRKEGTGNGFECIRIGTSGGSLSNSRTIVSDNLFESVNGELETISVKSSENIITKNIYKGCKGTITLRHGNRSIVCKNKLLQDNVNGSGGIRIVGEDHIVYSNLLKNVNGGMTTGSGISMTNGIKNSPLNKYFQVKRARIVKNVLLNNNCDVTIGLSKSGGNLTPVGCVFKENIIYKTSNNPIFSSKGDGSSDMVFSNNKFYGTNFGKNPKDCGSLSKPNEFNPSSINENNYGTNDLVGTDWTKQPEFYDLKIDIETYYTNIKNDILSEIDMKNVIMKSALDPVPPIDLSVIAEEEEHSESDSSSEEEN